MSCGYTRFEIMTSSKLLKLILAMRFIPALTRLGGGPVGVFTELKPATQTKLYALIPL